MLAFAAEERSDQATLSIALALHITSALLKPPSDLHKYVSLTVSSAILLTPRIVTTSPIYHLLSYILAQPRIVLLYSAREAPLAVFVFLE